ncbi:SPOR domain-containing protein [Oceanobacter mangrovi]|uniref:SPOR domain-containing protein n=1 Tax=Oceanobacter mangrovi TaxID=2862510 RepID=UPI001C8D5844|nr:SPOR domain-containing protein [Oceanobacter mangrovi]
MAVAEHYRTIADVVHLPAEKLANPAILTGMLAAQLKLASLPADEVAAREVLLEAARDRAADADPLLVVIKQAELLPEGMLQAIGQLALMASNSIAFCLFGADGFGRGLKESPTLAPVYRIQLDEPLTQDPVVDEFVFSAQNDTSSEAAALAELNLDIPVEISTAGVASSSTGKKHQRKKASSLLASLTKQAGLVLGLIRQRLKGGVGLALILVASLLMTVAVVGALYSGDDEPEPPMLVTQLQLPDLATVKDPVDNLPAVTGRGKQDLVAGNSLNSPSPVAATTQAPVLSVESSSATDVRSGAVTRAEGAAPAVVEAAKPVVAPKAPEKAKAVVQKSLVSSPAKPKYSGWLGQDGWAVQLIGTSEQQGADVYLNRWQKSAGGRLLVYRSIRNGAPWYVVVGGAFASRDEATGWANRLPSGMKNGTPWVRELSAIRTQIDPK